MTKQKQALLSVILENEGHKTAEEIIELCKGSGVEISRATVYRNLSALVEEGSIRRIVVPGEPDRYDNTLSPHEHILCERCQKMADVCMSDIKEFLETRVGEAISSYDLCIRYVCPTCKKQNL